MGKLSDKAKGRVKQAVGDLTGDKHLRREGVADEVKGDAKDAIDSARRAIDEADRATRNPRK